REHLVVAVELDEAAVGAADVGEGMAAADHLQPLAALARPADDGDDLLLADRRLDPRRAAAVGATPVRPAERFLGHHPRRSTCQVSSTASPLIRWSVWWSATVGSQWAGSTRTRSPTLTALSGTKVTCSSETTRTGPPSPMSGLPWSIPRALSPQLATA